MPRVLPVESRNQWFQRVETLKRNRAKRHREGAFVVEGVRSLNQLAAHREWEFEAYLYAPSRPLSSWATETLRSSRAAVHLELSLPLMEELSGKEETSELLAVVRIPSDDPAGLPSSPLPLYVLLDQPALPGNLGTIIRSCDGLGTDGIVVFGHAADLYDPQTVRGAAGSFFALPVIRLTTWGALHGWLDGVRARNQSLQIVGTTAHAGVWPEEVSFDRPTIVAFGNETDGLSHKVAELCDLQVTIPMSGSASSLNVACAATAILYEARRQRRKTHVR
ncbi:MAG: TrmH family RNA methyltransferase [Longimicrobiales bacterium]